MSATPRKSPKDSADLALIDKIMKSTSSKSPRPPLTPPKISLDAHRGLATAAAEKRRKRTSTEVKTSQISQSPKRKAPRPPTSPLKPKREAPAPPKMEDDVPQSSAFGVDAPPQSLSSTSARKLSKTQTTSQTSAPKRAILTRERAATILRKARESIGLGGMISPETDSEASDDDEMYIMSGGLQNGDLSERELSGKPPRKVRVSKFHEDFSEPLEGPTPIEEPSAESRQEVKITKDKRSSLRSPEKAGRAVEASLNSPEKPKNETVTLTRAYERSTRPTIRDDSYVVDSESEREYYESVGPVGGCVVG